ncbi:TIGR04104 family putative zinc finger protein [Halobacillus litoralis]|uniref:CXXC-20-CXXC protein n=1 Tax=Halobacillus litoralis TaxID=45668 RepID=A0A410MHT5_9BACI|nr:TIGR04104 family putative zinc finger protein [Halobacillus litoralis]QAS54302.1 hypothetical protein HLI_19825 [Halobacillus litoralis]
MGVVICKKCGDAWTFRQAFVSGLMLQRKKICPQCRARQYPTRKSRHRSSMLSFAAFLVFLIIVETFQMRLAYSLVFAGFVLLVTAVVNPLVIQLSNEEESHW